MVDNEKTEWISDGLFQAQLHFPWRPGISLTHLLPNKPESAERLFPCKLGVEMLERQHLKLKAWEDGYLLRLQPRGNPGVLFQSTA